MITSWWAVLTLGLLIGGLSGVLGIGGGVFLIPGLMYLFNFSQQRAQGTTLAALVPPIGLFAAIQYHRQGYVDIWSAAWIAAGFALGSYVSASYIRHIPIEVLGRVFGCLLIFIGVRMIVISDRRVAVVAATIVTLAFTWIVFFTLRAIGMQYGVERGFREKLSQISAASPLVADYQI